MLTVELVSRQDVMCWYMTSSSLNPAVSSQTERLLLGHFALRSDAKPQCGFAERQRNQHTHVDMHLQRSTYPPTHRLRAQRNTRMQNTHTTGMYCTITREEHHLASACVYACAHTHSIPTRRRPASLHLGPQLVSINLPVARRGLLRLSASLCNLLLMCCTLSLSEPIWSDCEQTEIPPMLSEQVLLMGLSIRPSPITACLQSPLNTLHQRSPDFSNECVHVCTHVCVCMFV